MQLCDHQLFFACLKRVVCSPLILLTHKHSQLHRELRLIKKEIYSNPDAKLDDKIKRLRQANYKLEYKQRHNVSVFILVILQQSCAKPTTNWSTSSSATT